MLLHMIGYGGTGSEGKQYEGAWRAGRRSKKMSENAPKLEEALVSSANQEPHAAEIHVRARSRTPMNPAITATSSDDLKEASESEKGIMHVHVVNYIQTLGSAACTHIVSLLSSTVLIFLIHTETEALLSTVDNKTLSKTINIPFGILRRIISSTHHITPSLILLHMYILTTLSPNTHIYTLQRRMIGMSYLLSVAH